MRSKSSPFWNNSLLNWKAAASILLVLLFFHFVLLGCGFSLSPPKGESAAAEEPDNARVYCLDRLEKEWAVLVRPEETLLVNKHELPEFAREGDFLLVAADAAGNIITAEIDWLATRAARERIKLLLRQLLETSESEKPLAESQSAH